jgi:hypothetical protein
VQGGLAIVNPHLSTALALRNLGLDEKTREILAEEVHVRIVARQRMQDVRFELTAKRQQSALDPQGGWWRDDVANPAWVAAA